MNSKLTVLVVGSTYSSVRLIKEVKKKHCTYYQRFGFAIPGRGNQIAKSLGSKLVNLTLTLVLLKLLIQRWEIDGSIATARENCYLPKMKRTQKDCLVLPMLLLMSRMELLIIYYTIAPHLSTPNRPELSVRRITNWRSPLVKQKLSGCGCAIFLPLKIQSPRYLDNSMLYLAIALPRQTNSISASVPFPYLRICGTCSDRQMPVCCGTNNFTTT